MRTWLAALLAVGVFAIRLHAQSLADVAKKTEEQRTDKTAPKAEKLYSNKDLKEPIQGGVGTTPNSITAEEPPTAAVPASSPDFKRDEVYWRERMRTVHAKVDDDQAFLDAAVVRERDLDRRLHLSRDNNDFIRDRVLRTSVDIEWTQAVAEVSRLKTAVASDQRAVRTAEEEARRADVPPAWLVRIQ